MQPVFVFAANTTCFLNIILLACIAITLPKGKETAAPKYGWCKSMSDESEGERNDRDRKVGDIEINEEVREMQVGETEVGEMDVGETDIEEIGIGGDGDRRGHGWETEVG